ncbi:MAG TPA: LuxR C-terminal-related transcriptional regulator [Polyangiaceae bacterium]|nr:LuxR C-terminal-related transcriptional regulator [Polyangiaceae bacterium]
MRGTILLLTSDEADEAGIAEAVGTQPFDVLVTPSVIEAERWVAKGRIDIVVADETSAGLDLLNEFFLVSPNVVHILSLCSSMDGVASFLAEGIVFRAIQKPWSLRVLGRVLHEAMQQAALSFAVRLGPLPNAVNSMKPAPPSCEDANPPSSAQALSVRESEVLALLARDYSTSQIARKLTISVFTVRNHVKSIFRKLGVASRRELQLRANSMDLRELN